MVSAIRQHKSATGVHVSLRLNPPSTALRTRSLQGTGFECPASNIKVTLVICFAYGNIYVSMLFSQIIPKQLLSISVFPLPWLSTKPSEFTSLGFLLSHGASSWLISPKALLLCIRSHLVVLIVDLGSWLPTVGWPDLRVGIEKKPACSELDDRARRAVGRPAVFFSPICCKTDSASALLPDILCMVFGHVVVKATMPENFSKFSQLWNNSFLWIFRHQENQTEKANKVAPLILPSYPTISQTSEAPLAKML